MISPDLRSLLERTALLLYSEQEALHLEIRKASNGVRSRKAATVHLCERISDAISELLVELDAPEEDLPSRPDGHRR